MTLAVGTYLGRYEICSQLGTGGMGEVYLARDPKINRNVAIKVLPAAFASDFERLRRFEQEVQATGKLKRTIISHTWKQAACLDGWGKSTKLEARWPRTLLYFR